MKRYFLIALMQVICISAFSQAVKLQNKPVCIDNFDNIAELDKIFSSSRIILLGEAGHGDGATFELKSKLIEYLYKKHGYTILINEASGFTEAVNMNFEKAVPLQIFEKTADTHFAKSQQFAELKRFLSENPSFKYYGLDCQPTHIDMLIDNLKSISNSTTNFSAKKYISEFISFWEQATGRKESAITLESLNTLDSTTIYYMNNLKIFNHADTSYVKQVLLNNRGNLNAVRYGMETRSNIDYRRLNWRDSVMASNAEWIINKFPNEKVIISAANFHNAKNVHNIIYNNDSTHYTRLQLAGWYIAKKFGDKAYSLAISSTSGTFGYCTDTAVYNIEEAARFKVDENVLETHLLIPNCEMSFYDFRKDKKLENQIYRSLIFGPNMHRGKWSTAFDGIINIRKQKASTLQQ